MWSEWVKRDLPNAVITRVAFGHTFSLKDEVIFEVGGGGIGEKRGRKGKKGKKGQSFFFSSLCCFDFVSTTANPQQSHTTTTTTGK